jgi:hypothetical protein
VSKLRRKILLAATAFLFIAMLALPVSAVSATKPEPDTMSLEGTFYILMGLSPARMFPAGESGNQIWK